MIRNKNQQIKSTSHHNGLILLYHFIDYQTPDGLNRLHNIPPPTLQRHIEDLSACFEFVSLQEFSQAQSKRGLATITFDDGYKNVLQNALPVLESLDCSATLFLNPVTFSKCWNWRDKVRYLIDCQRAEEFSSQYPFCHKSGRFYRYSKHPDNNSASLDQALNGFLKNHPIDLYGDYPYIQIEDLISHPLISYGNHSQNHYVLASLTNQQQVAEIEVAEQCLQDIPELTLADCFSAPFGGTDDINSSTYELLKTRGYHSLLMSRQKLQPARSLIHKIQILERFMPKSDDIIGELADIRIRN